ncbi:unnamed protein product [Gadus morhua 'NCC']
MYKSPAPSGQTHYPLSFSSSSSCSQLPAPRSPHNTLPDPMTGESAEGWKLVQFAASMSTAFPRRVTQHQPTQRPTSRPYRRGPTGRRLEDPCCSSPAVSFRQTVSQNLASSPSSAERVLGCVPLTVTRWWPWVFDPGGPSFLTSVPASFPI